MNSPEPITFYCVHCGTKLLVPVELAGETGPCPQCTAVITSPLVSSVIVPPQISLPAPAGLPLAGAITGLPEREPAPAPYDSSFDDFIRPGLGGRGGSGAPLPEPVVAPRPAVQGRRLPSRDPEEFSVELAQHGYGDLERHRPFPVALVALLLVVFGGGGYLSWRMGLWETLQASGGEQAAPLGAQIARTESTPILAEAKSVASLGQSSPAIPPQALPAAAPAPAPPAAVPPALDPGSETKSSTVSPQIPLSDPIPVITAGLPMRRPASVLKPASDEPSPQGALPPPAGTQENAPPSPGADSPAAESVQASTEPVTKDSPPLDRARDVVHRFLEAPSWKERVGLIEVSGDPAAALSSYHQNHADLPLTNYRLDYFHTETRPGDNGAAYIFFLTYANETDGFPVMVMENRGEFRLDWDLFLEFRERTFQHFVEESQEKPGTFRVVLQRVTYWESDRDQIPLVDQLLCYKIDPPYPGFTRFAFVDRDTPIGKQLAKDLSWESDPLAAEVQLRWSTFPGGKSYLTIDQMVSRTWVRPLPPGMLGKSATAKN